MVNAYFIYFCEVLALLSFFCSGFIVLAHLKVSELRKHPGDLIMMVCLTQTLYDLHWMTLIPAVNR